MNQNSNPANSQDSGLLNWEPDDSAFEIDGLRLRCIPRGERPHDNPEPIVMKPRALVEKLDRNLPDQADNVVELGIWGGGSVIFNHKRLQPRRMVAIEFSNLRARSLDEYIKREGLEKELVPYYKTSQGDAIKLESAVQKTIGDSPIDVVLDDASHWYEETRVSFNLLFPKLRPGGIYVIEDWNWSHAPRFQEEGSNWFDKPALTNLVFEIIMAAGTRPNLFPKINIVPPLAIVTRGEAEINASIFDVSRLATSKTRGRTFSGI